MTWFQSKDVNIFLISLNRLYPNIRGFLFDIVKRDKISQNKFLPFTLIFTILPCFIRPPVQNKYQILNNKNNSLSSLFV